MARHRSLLLIALAAVTVLVGAPLAGWPDVVRLPAVLVPALMLVVLVLRPWYWDADQWRALEAWQPSPRLIRVGILGVGMALSWIVLTRFKSGEINGVDFTVYFDRPCFQTLQGRVLFIETADVPQFSRQTGLEHHAFWGMLPLCALYAISATPFWLLAVSVIAVIAGAVHTLRIMQHLGAPGVLASATALAFLLNDTTARTLNYGFHPEVLYAWCIPWLIDAGLKGRRRQFLAAGVATILVKEDAVMPLFAASLALALNAGRTRNRLTNASLAVPVVVALVNLGVYYTVVVPELTDREVPAYGHFWESYGPTPPRALVGMIAQPQRVLIDTLQSGFFSRVILPHLFLPVVGWRWAIGIVPMVVLYSASDDPQLRAFGIYYAMPLIPFLVIGASTAALMIARLLVPEPGRASVRAAAVVVAGALLVGSGDRGYSLRPWRPEVADVPRALSRLVHEDVVLVQSGLYPHAGYEERIQLLTWDTLRSPRYADAAILIAPHIDAYPLGPADVQRLSELQPVGSMPGTLLAVRAPARRRVLHTHRQ
jgi:uncharacterized membrane protein